MISINPQFVTDAKGKKTSVLLSIKEYNAIVVQLEVLEGVKLYDEAKSSDEEVIPIDEAFEIIERNRKK